MRMNEQEKPKYSEILVIIRTNTFNKEQRTTSSRNKMLNITFKNSKSSTHQLNTYWKNVSTVTESSSNSALKYIHTCIRLLWQPTQVDLIAFILQHAERYTSRITTSTQHCRCRMQARLRLPCTLMQYQTFDYVVFHTKFLHCHFNVSFLFSYYRF